MLDLRTATLAARTFGSVASRLWRILSILFHEVIGLIFLVMAGWGGLWLLRTYRQFHGEGDVYVKMIVVGLFAVTMACFGFSSFWKARQISRRG